MCKATNPIAVIEPTERQWCYFENVNRKYIILIIADLTMMNVSILPVPFQDNAA